MLSRLLFSIAILSIALVLRMDKVMAQDEAESRCAVAVAGLSAEMYFIGMGDAYFSQQNFANAIEAYTCALEANPSYVPAYINRGYAYNLQRDDVKALEDFNQALTLEPENLAALNNRGRLYLSQGRIEPALADFDSVTLLYPENPLGYINRAMVWAVESNYELAIEDLTQAIALDPESAEAHRALSMVYVALAYQSEQTARELDSSPRPPFISRIEALFADFSAETFNTWLGLVIPKREGTP